MNIFKWCQFRYSRRKCNVVSGQSCLFCHRLNSSFNCVCLSVSVLTCDLTLGPSLEKCPFQSRILLSTGEQNKSTAWKQCNGPSKAHSNQYTLTHTHTRTHISIGKIYAIYSAPHVPLSIWIYEELYNGKITIHSAGMMPMWGMKIRRKNEKQKINS